MRQLVPSGVIGKTRRVPSGDQTGAPGLPTRSGSSSCAPVPSPFATHRRPLWTYANMLPTGWVAYGVGVGAGVAGATGLGPQVPGSNSSAEARAVFASAASASEPPATRTLPSASGVVVYPFRCTAIVPACFQEPAPGSNR